MRALDVVVALFAVFMLIRHGSRAAGLFRGEARGRPMAFVSLVNVALALLLLAFSLKDLARRLVPR